MVVVDEDNVQKALFEIGQGSSIIQAAKRHSVSTRTLRRRLHGAKSRVEAHSKEMKFSMKQQDSMADLVILHKLLGRKFTHNDIGELARDLAVKTGVYPPRGLSWVVNFVRRYKEPISTLDGRHVAVAKYQPPTETVEATTTPAAPATESPANGDQPESSYPKFVEFKDSPAIGLIRPENRYSADLLALVESANRQNMTTGTPNHESVQNDTSVVHAWASVIECVSSTGRAISPFLGITGNYLEEEWYPRNNEFMSDWVFSASKKGWDTEELCLLWLKRVFIPQTTTEIEDAPRLLVLDAEGKFINYEFLFTCATHRIRLLFLVSKPNHLVTPVEATIFSKLRAGYTQAMPTAGGVKRNSRVNTARYLYCYSQARRQALTPSNILAGWANADSWTICIRKPFVPKPDPPPPPPQPLQDPAAQTFTAPQSSCEFYEVLNTLPCSKLILPYEWVYLSKVAEVIDKYANQRALELSLAKSSEQRRREEEENPDEQNEQHEDEIDEDDEDFEELEALENDRQQKRQRTSASGDFEIVDLDTTP